MRYYFKKILKRTLFLCLMVFALGMYAQGKIVTGTITSSDV